MTTTQTPGFDYRSLMARVQEVVDSVEATDELYPAVHDLALAVVDRLREDLGVTGGRIYRRRGTDYRLLETFGDAPSVAAGTRLPGDDPTVLQCRAQGTVYVREDDPGLDRELERMLGTRGFAAIEMGEEEYLMSFDLVPGHNSDDILFSLGLLRHTLSQKIRQERMQDVLRQARRIQTSILPRQKPVFGPFDIAGRSDALETVGGDFYDFLPITDKILGLAVADVSGHGLPAALQVRDIYTGLRMGMARDFKIVRTVERLNQIIHQSTLTSRFVSMFYGELELDGTLIYVNAGHPPPFHLSADGTVRALEKGGVVLGPVPGATYMRGYLTLQPGDLLLLYTDGVIDTSCDGIHNHDYGFERLVEIARRCQSAPAKEVVEAVFDDLNNFCGAAKAGDDRTVAVVSYPATVA